MARNDGTSGETPLLIWPVVALAAVWLWGCTSPADFKVGDTICVDGSKYACACGGIKQKVTAILPDGIVTDLRFLHASELPFYDRVPCEPTRAPTPPALHMEVPASPPVINSCIGLLIDLQYARDPWKFAETCQTHTDVEVDLRDGTKIRLDIDEFERRVKGEP